MTEDFALRCWRALDALMREAMEHSEVHTRDVVREAEEVCWEFALQFPAEVDEVEA